MVLWVEEKQVVTARITPPSTIPRTRASPTTTIIKQVGSRRMMVLRPPMIMLGTTTANG